MELRPSEKFRKEHPEYARLSDAALWSIEQNYTSSIPETGCLPNGIHTETFSGLECEVERKINQFYRTMNSLYKNFNIIGTTAAQNRYGISVTLTYKI